MARRKSGASSPISLFPFLSVLSCVIGTLALMIAVVTLTSMADNPLTRADNFARITRSVDDGREEIERLRQAIEQEVKGRKRMAELGRQISQLQQRMAAFSAEQDQAKVLQGRLLKSTRRIAQLTEQKRQLEKQLSQLSFEAESNQRQNAQAEEFAPVQILPAGASHNAHAWYAVCESNQLVLYSDLNDSSPVRSSRLASSRNYKNFLKKVRSEKGGILIFLIRRDGVGVFQAASEMAQRSRVKFGKLAVPWSGPIDLSAFFQGQGEADAS